MATKTNNTKPKSSSTRSTNSPKKSGRQSKQAINDESIPRSKVIKFIIGLLIIFYAIFLIVSFSSYLFSGAEDYSLCTSEFPEGMKVSNVGGKLGLYSAFFFINNGFGLASYLIPVFLIISGLYLIGSIKVRLLPVFVKMAIMMIWLSFVLAVIAKLLPFTEDSHISLGGSHGDFIHAKISDVVGEVGVYCILLLTTILYLVYYSVLTIDSIVNSIKKLKKAKELALKLRLRSEKLLNNEESEGTDAEKDKNNSQESKQQKVYTDPQRSTTFVYDAQGNLISENGETSTGDINGTNVTDESSPYESLDSQTIKVDFDESRTDNVTNGDSSDDLANQFDQIVQQNTQQTSDIGKTDDSDEPQFVIDSPVETEEGDGNIERGDILTPYDPKLDLSHYQYPTLDLLEHSDDNAPNVDMDEQNANKERIIHVLKTFGVEISSIKATIGPTITLYEITPAEGTRINKIRNLEDDIALSLAAEGIRIIAPIPGKGTIGIEVPNKKKCIVSMESILNSKTYQESKMELPCAIGKTITNEVFMVDLAKAPHMLVAGATGQGKSVGLNAIITSLLYKKHPTELKMVMVDPKKVEFSVYAPIANQFLAKLEDEDEAIITDNQRVIKTLNALCKLMDDRYMLLKKASVRNIKEYNEKFKERKLNPEDGHNYMPYYVVIIDEFGDLIMTAGKDIELPICRIAQLARAVGIHMIIATQRPTTRIITGTIKANFPARVAFKVSAMMDSRIILDRPGANQLIGRGDMLYLQSADPVRVQCAFVDTPEVNRICKFISEQPKFPCMTYLPEPPMDDADGAGGKDVDMQNLDPMFGEVARMVVSKNAGSTSKIQREFSIGYNRAGRLMDQLENAGIVGAQMGSKPREVLIQDLITLDNLLSSLGAN